MAPATTSLATKSVELPGRTRLVYAEQGDVLGVTVLSLHGFLALVRTGTTSSAGIHPSHRSHAEGPWRFGPSRERLPPLRFCC